jgi:hypothetical protein
MRPGALVPTGLPEGMPEGFPRLAALWVNGLLDSVEEVATVAGVDVVTAEDWLRCPAVSTKVDALAIEHRDSGQLARGQSVALLTKTVAKLQALVDAGELSAGTLVRVAEMAARVSGVVAEKPALVNSEPKFSVNIILDNKVKPAARTVQVETQEVTDV